MELLFRQHEIFVSSYEKCSFVLTKFRAIQYLPGEKSNRLFKDGCVLFRNLVVRAGPGCIYLFRYFPEKEYTHLWLHTAA